MSAAKNMLNMGRMSPASVDSGFDSSFPSSPDSSSIDSPRLHATVVSDTLRCLTTNISPTKCPLLLKEAHIPEPCCSSRSSPSLSSSGYGSSLPSSASQTSLSSFSSRVDCLDLSSLKEPLSIVCERPESVFVQPVDLPNVIDSEHSSNHNGEKADEELKVESFTDCPSTSSSTCYIDEPSLTSRQERLRSECHWDKCTNRFRCDNDMYDHVVKNHLEPLRPPDCLSPTSRGRCSPKSRLKNLACKWGDCKMFLWLEDHFATRHAGKAQPYRCLIEGCSLRFTLKRALEDHLRSGHEKAKDMDDSSDLLDVAQTGWVFHQREVELIEELSNSGFLCMTGTRHYLCPQIGQGSIFSESSGFHSVGANI
ncbi:unnamed protein product [Toxocara canis]|uniref:C2H2-type domain-containing protein n=1 Tax=Toxocara canis TaxID=6265 RepID=A0A183V2Q7_TOXCA|nr:unnamed protein product [Toxocara canis]